jgi:hypothetical protein
MIEGMIEEHIFQTRDQQMISDRLILIIKEARPITEITVFISFNNSGCGSSL